MLKIGIECKDIAPEKLFTVLESEVKPCFKVWMYNKKVYAIFRLDSSIELKPLLKN
jgi:hypothetical protein